LILLFIPKDGSEVGTLLDAFSFWFVIGAATLPVGISSFAIMGEKLDRSLEPLLATPVTDGEVLVGKGLAAFVPTIIAGYAGAAIYMSWSDIITGSDLGYLYYPNLQMVIILLLLMPLTIIMSIGVNILVSARATDMRTAYNLGGILFLPFIVIYVASELPNGFPLNPTNLLLLGAIFVLVDILVFYVVVARFRREEILTKWK
jgi:ABC-2 type transport system permease protein